MGTRTSSWAKCGASGIAVAILAAIPALSRAEVPVPSELQTARKLFTDAERDEQATRWEPALRKLQGVASIKETPGVRYHIGNCLEHLGRLVEALASFERAHQLAEQERVNEVLELTTPRLETLRARIPTITIRIHGEARQATVKLDARLIDGTLLGTPMGLNPGMHQVWVEFPGKAPMQRNVELAESQSESVEFTAPAASPKPEVSQPAPASLQPATEAPVNRSAPVPTRAWIAYGAGLALGIGGYLAYRKAGSVADDSEKACARAIACDPARASSVHRWDGAALGLWVGAAAAVGVGLVWTLQASSAEAPKTAIVLTPSGASVQGGF